MSFVDMTLQGGALADHIAENVSTMPPNTILNFTLHNQLLCWRANQYSIEFTLHAPIVLEIAEASDATMNKEEMKKAAGIEAAKFVRDGMNIGLGTGSTVRYTIIEIGRRIREEGLNVRGIPTSRATEELAKEQGIPLTDFAQIEVLDLTIDGADEVDEDLNLTKGGGGALLREKIIAANSIRLIVVVDDAKLVRHLGTTYPLPVEITPFAWEATFRRFKTFNCDVVIRRTPSGDLFLSDNGNYILDCKFEIITSPELTERFLNVIPGVVEVGLFVKMCDTVIVGTEDGVKIIGG